MKTRARFSAFVFAGSIFALAFAAPAATNYWIGGNGNYTNAANWSLGVVPAKTDVAMFTNNATYTITVTSSIDPVFHNTSGNVTFNGDLATAGAPISIVASQNIVGSGATTTMSSTGGNITLVAGANFGTLDVQTGGTFNLAGTGTTLSVSGATSSGGVINLNTGSAMLGTLDISSTGSFNNAGNLTLNGFVRTSLGGSINLTAASTMITTGDIQSAGTFSMRGTGTLNSAGSATFSGPVDFQSGTANFLRDTVIQRPGEDIQLGPTVPTEMLMLSLVSTQVSTSQFDTGGTKTTFIGRTNENAGPATFLMSGPLNFPYFSGYVCVGAGGGSNSLVVSNGARPAIASFTTLGLTAGSPNNLLRLTGPGSRLDIFAGGLEIGRGSTGNTVRVDNGAFLGTAGTALIGSPYAGPTANNTVIVDGANSKWTNQSTIVVGAGTGTNNNLIVTNGGTVRAPTITIGSQFGSFNGGVTVAVGDATLDGTMDILVGSSGSGSSVRVFEGGRVTAGNSVVVGQNPGSSNNLVEVDGGTLSVTNASTNAVIDVRRGTLMMNGGNVTADKLVVTNGNQSSVVLNSGTLKLRSATITNDVPLMVGDGTNAARLIFLDACPVTIVPITIRSHGMCAGSSCSEILVKVIGAFGDGTVTNGGTISPGLSAGALRFVGNLVQQPGGALEFEIGGVTQGIQYDLLVFSGSVTLDGSMRIARLNNFTPAAGDSFTLMTFGSGSGAFTNIASGARLKTVDSLGSFLITLTSTSLVASAYLTTDADGDGIEDAWALQYFGHTPLTTVEKNADADADGASNYNEFVAGTNPVDGTSVFKASPSLSGEGEPVLRFPCVAGKTYRVFYWDLINAAFTEVASPLFSYPAPGLCEWRDDGSATGGAPALQRRFYRVAVQ